MSFENRWMIVGNLTTTAPLHIGNGDVAHRDGLFNAKDNLPVEINAVCVNKDGHASIPGTTLKGKLRAWAKSSGLNTANFENLFGSDDPEKESSVGGKIEIYDASAVGVPAFSVENQPPYWDESRSTSVMAGVAINRRTRTASEERLFHHEFVPPGVSFAVTITGQNLTDAELEDLLFVFTGFNQGELALGAGEGDGWGKMNWELIELRRLTKTQVVDWINSGAVSVGYQALTNLSTEEQQNWLNKVTARQVAIAPSSLTLDLKLEFDSNFLVNDPSKVGAVEEDENNVGHALLLDVSGKLLLPASSFRGALRSQAEKILRTIGDEFTACHLDNDDSCEAVYDTNELGNLCPACQLFGAAGWKSPVTISPFTTAAPIPPELKGEAAALRGHETGKLGTQEFVAIDRFTGGGAEGKKFNAQSAYRPTLRGQISFDLQAISRIATDCWPLGLLALTLRDLIEGDIKFGYGAAKGYGVVRANIETISLPDWSQCPDTFKTGITEDQWQSMSAIATPDAQLQGVMTRWLNELVASVSTEGEKQ